MSGDSYSFFPFKNNRREIKFINKKTDFSRKTSSIIVLFTVFALLIGFIVWGTFTLISESTDLLEALNTYLEKAIKMVNGLLEKVDMDKLVVSDEIKSLIQSTSSDVLNKAVSFVQEILNNMLQYLKSIPTALIYIVITILATYFITSDKFYILDRLEHHVPKKILKKITVKVQKIISSLGAYLKAEITLVGISFVVVLMGLNIFYLMGMNVGYPLLMALFIGFVDALPILRLWNGYGAMEYYFIFKQRIFSCLLDFGFIYCSISFKTNFRT